MTEISEFAKERESEVKNQKDLANKATKDFEREQNAQVKTLKEAMQGVDKVHEVYVPELDCKLAYKRISLDSFVDIQGIQDRTKIAKAMLFQMLHAADPTVTEEEVGKMPFELASSIIAKIMGQTPFLPKRTQS